MDYIKIAKSNADEAKKLMVRLNLFDSSRAVQHSRSYVYFPITIKDTKSKKLFSKIGAVIISKKEEKIKKESNYESLISKILTSEESKQLSKGYDQIGDIAIIEFKGAKQKEIKIAKALMDSNKSIRTVLAKAGAVSGKFRVRKLRYVSGRKNYIANYKENGCLFRFDVRKVFFSNRLSYERSRILKLIKEKEKVLVMFAGVGPFAIEIAKNIKSTKVIAIELNKAAYNHMLENIKLNKTNNVSANLGDVKILSRKYKNFAERIIMPLPKSSLEFLNEVYMVASTKAIVHLYVFTEPEKLEKIYDKIRVHSKAKNYKVKFISNRIARPYSSKEAELVIDYEIRKGKGKQRYK